MAYIHLITNSAYTKPGNGNKIIRANAYFSNYNR